MRRPPGSASWRKADGRTTQGRGKRWHAAAVWQRLSRSCSREPPIPRIRGAWLVGRAAGGPLGVHGQAPESCAAVPPPWRLIMGYQRQSHWMGGGGPSVQRSRGARPRGAADHRALADPPLALTGRGVGAGVRCVPYPPPPRMASQWAAPRSGAAGRGAATAFPGRHRPTCAPATSSYYLAPPTLPALQDFCPISRDAADCDVAND